MVVRGIGKAVVKGLEGLLGMLLVLAVAWHSAAQPAGVAAMTPGELPTALQLLDIYECTRCHRVSTPHRLLGPSLQNIRARADAAFIRASILDPDAVVAPGYPAGLMRTRLQELGFYDDVARQPAILDRLVALLLGEERLPGAAAEVPQGDDQQRPGERLARAPAQILSRIVDAAPVTLTQYMGFIEAGGYTTKRYWERPGWAIVVQRRKRLHPTDWEAQQHHAPESPVVGVTWYEADAYCRWAGTALPTEIQWERACQDDADWSGPGLYWEWTAEALWRGRGEQGAGPQHRCASRIQSYPALEGQHTGFRCRAAARTTAP